MLIVLVVVGFAILFWLIVKLQRAQAPPMDPQALLLLQRQIETFNQDMKGSLTENVRQQQTASHQMTSAVRDVTERLVKIEETNKQVLSFSGQLENLQRILTNPKQRGILGEYYLETLLKNIFAPDQYQMQYKFKDGEIVDAAIFVQNKIVPVDSKFSLENYNRLVMEQNETERERLEKLFVNDLKTRIKETAKYVRPEEGTMDFAFMFIPHEAIYYDLLINKIGAVTDDTENLLQKAASTYHVIIVSPTSFTAYLQTVLQGLKALKIEEQAKEIRVRIADLSKHLQAYEQHHQAIGRNLGTTVNQYNLSNREFAKIDKDMLKVTGQGMGFQPTLIDKPQDE
ncbi:MAG: DNA recombination protein RmuC [Candidatus Uhrbacteria bacterium]|nr:DNA recombination protein RmuC [Candidatus Uhrbacteria bacterium]MDP3793129.1 DNA recombination protein RmuC [Candidatus Uhrbacteria bacterium]